jgi:4-hydroxybenzoate polyprenyltransferase
MADSTLSRGATASPSRWLSAFAVLRPAQWVKNLLVLAPVFFSQQASRPEVLLDAAAATLAFCLVSSAVYALNDVVDAERDRAHPRKRLRPVASGDLSPAAAVSTGVLVAALAAGLSLRVGAEFAACAAVYLALQVVYTFGLKHAVILDVFAIASGFVLRVVAGAAAVAVPVSHWLYLCTLLLALFLALAKRRAELVELEQGAASHRRNLADYSLPFIDQLVSIVSGSAIVAYALYTVAAETMSRVGNDRLKYTIPLVLLGFFRYLFLVHQRRAGGEPHALLLRDRPLQLVLVAYAALGAWALYL